MFVIFVYRLMGILCLIFAVAFTLLKMFFFFLLSLDDHPVYVQTSANFARHVRVTFGSRVKGGKIIPLSRCCCEGSNLRVPFTPKASSR